MFISIIYDICIYTIYTYVYIYIDFRLDSFTLKERRYASLIYTPPFKETTQLEAAGQKCVALVVHVGSAALRSDHLCH